MIWYEWLLFILGLLVMVGWMGICLWHIIEQHKRPL